MYQKASKKNTKSGKRIAKIYNSRTLDLYTKKADKFISLFYLLIVSIQIDNQIDKNNELSIQSLKSIKNIKTIFRFLLN